MKFMLLFKPDKDPQPGVSACKSHVPEMARLIDQYKKAGVLLSTEALLPSESGARIQFADGKLPVIDGPYAEAKELVAGFAIIQAESRAAAIEIARQFLRVAGEGECDIRQVFEPAA